MEYDVRGELELRRGDGEDAVSGLTRFGGTSFEDAVGSVRASGGQVRPGCVRTMRSPDVPPAPEYARIGAACPRARMGGRKPGEAGGRRPAAFQKTGA